MIGLLATTLIGVECVMAASNTNFTQSISGALGIDIVDGSGNSVSSPSVTFSSIPFSMTDQSTTGTLGTASEKIRVTNPSATATWSAAIAATGGSTSMWSGTSGSYDYNDNGANATDGPDTDSKGGQMTINPAPATISGVGGTQTTNVSVGAATSFSEGSVESVTLMNSSTGAQAPGQWDLTGVVVEQTIPAAQAAGSYSMDMTLTVS